MPRDSTHVQAFALCVNVDIALNSVRFLKDQRLRGWLMEIVFRDARSVASAGFSITHIHTNRHVVRLLYASCKPRFGLNKKLQVRRTRTEATSGPILGVRGSRPSLNRQVVAGRYASPVTRTTWRCNFVFFAGSFGYRQPKEVNKHASKSWKEV